MKPLKAFTIPFVGLKQKIHHFDYQINNTFLEHFGYDEFNEAKIHVDLAFNKKETLFELEFTASGTVNVNCDVTNEPFDMPIQNTLLLVVKFGETYNDENEELLIIPHGAYELSVQQYIYELIVLAIPFKRVHPGVENGTLKSEILEKLDELSLKDTNELKNNNEETDPRWDKLKNLLNDK